MTYLIIFSFFKSQLTRSRELKPINKFFEKYSFVEKLNNRSVNAAQKQKTAARNVLLS